MKIIETPPVQYRLNDLAHIRYVIFEKDYTAFDMVLAGERIIPVANGLITLNPDTYIRGIYDSEKKRLLKAEGIPLAPDSVRYKFKRKSILFKLYFEPLTADERFVNLIEYEDERPEAKNQYEVCVEPSAYREIKCYYQSIANYISKT